jgi:DNA-binding IclR family transcriptional regulator
MTATDRLFVTALARGLGVLRVLSAATEPLKVSEIAKRMGLPQATAWRLCYTMIELGYLERVDRDRLRPGLPALSLGFAALAGRPLPELARPRMAQLASRFGGAISMAVFSDMQMLYIERVEGGETIFPGLRTGSRVSLLASAIGWGYLAGLPAAQRQGVLELAQQRFGAEYERVQSRLSEALAEFAVRGFVVNIGLLHPEINAVAVPIGSAGATPVGALSCGGPRSRFRPEMLENEAGPALRELAEQLKHTGQEGDGRPGAD